MQKLLEGSLSSKVTLLKSQKLSKNIDSLINQSWELSQLSQINELEHTLDQSKSKLQILKTHNIQNKSSLLPKIKSEEPSAAGTFNKTNFSIAPQAIRKGGHHATRYSMDKSIA
jgi:hypothetical protein